MLPAHVYHLVEAANWPSVQRHGLLSAQELIRRTVLQPAEQAQMSAAQRTGMTTLAEGILIRDQLPMPPGALQRCLVGMTPAEWYGLLNEKVFFWCDLARLERMARACSRRPQIVLTIDTKRLVARHAERMALTPINTGNARRQPATRGRATFVPYAEWLAHGWRSEAEALGTKPRPRRHAPVELTVAGAVPDAVELILDLKQVEAGEAFLQGSICTNSYDPG